MRLPLRYGYPGGAFQLGPFVLEGPPDRPWLVLGPTGSGKSTVLRLLAGSLGGGGSPLRAGERPSYLPQLPERALAGRNLAEDLCGEVRPPLSRRLALRGALRESGLSGVPLSRRSRDLSQGERRRVALALLRLSGASSWALDEPDAGLDAQGRRHLAQRLGAWWEERALRGLWIATHAFELYASLRPWVVVLEGGELVAQGPLAEVLQREEVFEALALGRRPAFQVWQGLTERYLGRQATNLMRWVNAGGRISQLQAILANRTAPR